MPPVRYRRVKTRAPLGDGSRGLERNIFSNRHTFIAAGSTPQSHCSEECTKDAMAEALVADGSAPIGSRVAGASRPVPPRWELRASPADAEAAAVAYPLRRRQVVRLVALYAAAVP